ncbi:hypothetical protein CVT25_014175 [Psilocybe cyanescens]|uniref:Uncharacterized protein n=1 Tax=Psilocybe cyanescens TaxID=93625 RepID=A0A409XUW3_PSICY|nr:hypothetical protein CVT25_014175 [Psilocybe cyanescens]
MCLVVSAGEGARDIGIRDAERSAEGGEGEGEEEGESRRRIRTCAGGAAGVRARPGSAQRAGRTVARDQRVGGARWGDSIVRMLLSSGAGAGARRGRDAEAKARRDKKEGGEWNEEEGEG